MTNFLKRRIEKLELVEQPGARLEITEIEIHLEYQEGDDPAQKIKKVQYLKLDSIDQNGDPIVTVYLPRNGRDEQESTPPANVGEGKK